MKRYLVGLIGLALLGASPLSGQSCAFGGRSRLRAQAGCNGGCNVCNGGCNACCDCCPHCGCKLVPVCQITCTTKKTTEHEYCCACKEICIPGVTPHRREVRELREFRRLRCMQCGQQWLPGLL